MVCCELLIKYMKQAYLIIAHNNFNHLTTLVNTLDCRDVFFYIHIDAKVEVPGSIRELKCANKIEILQKRRVRWGGQSQVRTELDLYGKAFENPDIEWFHLISGVDFPLKPISELNTFFELAEDVDCFMETEPLPRHLADRMRFYHFYVARPTHRKSIFQRINSKFLSMQCKVGIKRRHPEGLPFMFGSNWVDMRRRAVEILLQRHKDIIKYTNHTACSDEVYKQTFLQNCGLRIVPDNLRYIDWNAKQPSPKSLMIEDFDHIVASGKLFARKFDSPESESLIQQILEYISD